MRIVIGFVAIAAAFGAGWLARGWLGDEDERSPPRAVPVAQTVEPDPDAVAVWIP